MYTWNYGPDMEQHFEIAAWCLQKELINFSSSTFLQLQIMHEIQTSQKSMDLNVQKYLGSGQLPGHFLESLNCELN